MTYYERSKNSFANYGGQKSTRSGNNSDSSYSHGTAHHSSCPPTPTKQYVLMQVTDMIGDAINEPMLRSSHSTVNVTQTHVPVWTHQQGSLIFSHSPWYQSLQSIVHICRGYHTLQGLVSQCKGFHTLHCKEYSTVQPFSIL